MSTPGSTDGESPASDGSMPAMSGGRVWGRRARFALVAAAALTVGFAATSQSIGGSHAGLAEASQRQQERQPAPIQLAAEASGPIRSVSKATMQARVDKGCIPTLPCKGTANTYLLVTIQPEYSMLAEFEKRTEALLPLYRSNGWRLVGAFRTVVGDAPTYVNLWRVKDANQVQNGLTRSSVPDEYLDDIGAVVKTIKSETFQVLTDASFASK